MIQQKRPRVLVAMSGGVDSSVAAALLVEQGYEVIGATMQVWDYSSCDLEEGSGTCCSSSDVDDARAVADKLDIPFYVLNCQEEFKQAVIDPFVNDYLKGSTPLPCVNCNTYLKFDHLIRKMHELECDYLATGHYAVVENNEKGRPTIQTSADSWKDQTYFLFTLEPEILPRLLFPIGEMEKPAVRDYAEQNGLINARKKDSVGICFVGSQGYSNFIKDYAGGTDFKPGVVRLHPTGEVMAGHEGIHLFTYGQRKGLGFSYSEPLYVIKIDPETHEVWVACERYLYAKELEISRTNLLDEIVEGEELRVKIRYQHRGAVARLYTQGPTSYRVVFDEPQRAVTPGQAAVFYRDQQLVGGGWINHGA